MSDEDQSTTDDELFATSESEGGSQPASTTSNEDGDQDGKTESLDDLDGEESKEALELKEPKSTSSQKEARQKQIDAWYNKVSTGEKSLEDIPDKQSWIRKHVEKQLDLENKVEELDVETIIEQKLQSRLKTEADERKFNDLREELNSASLTDDQKEVIKQEYLDLRNRGLEKSVALDKARAIAGVNFSKSKPKITPPRQSSASSEVVADDWREKISKDDVQERVKRLEAEAKSFGF